MAEQPFQAFEDYGTIGLLDGNHDHASVILKLMRERMVVITISSQDYGTDLPG